MPVQFVPAQVWTQPPVVLQLNVQPPPEHVNVQLALSLQFIVHPPPAQLYWQLALPLQVSVQWPPPQAALQFPLATHELQWPVMQVVVHAAWAQVVLPPPPLALPPLPPPPLPPPPDPGLLELHAPRPPKQAREPIRRTKRRPLMHHLRRKPYAGQEEPGNNENGWNRPLTYANAPRRRGDRLRPGPARRARRAVRA